MPSPLILGLCSLVSEWRLTTVTWCASWKSTRSPEGIPSTSTGYEPRRWHSGSRCTTCRPRIRCRPSRCTTTCGRASFEVDTSLRTAEPGWAGPEPSEWRCASTPGSISRPRSITCVDIGQVQGPRPELRWTYSTRWPPDCRTPDRPVGSTSHRYRSTGHWPPTLP